MSLASRFWKRGSKLSSTARRRRKARRQFQLQRLEDRTVLSAVAPGAEQAAAYGQLPLSFEANQGQTAAGVNFLARGNGYALFLTPSEAVLSLHASGSASSPNAAPAQPAASNTVPTDVLRMQLIGGNPAATATGLDQQAGTSNYLIGNDPSQWQTNIANYGKVEYDGVYPGINLDYYGNQQQLEYDFVVAAGGNPGAIKLGFQGAVSITLDTQGNLVLHSSGGDVVEHAPVIYQETGGVRQAVSGQYVLESNDQVGFQIGAYDTSKPLVIDPVLSYSTYLGGTGTDVGQAIAVDASGNAYITGTTWSANFPTTAGSLQSTFGGSSDYSDAFVAKLNAAGTGLVYSTYLGGTSNAVGSAIAVDSAGNAYLTGYAAGSGYPTTADAFQRTSYASPFYDGFVTELNATGTALVYSTILGGTAADPGYSTTLDTEGQGIALDSSGNVYVTGQTASDTFATTAGAFQMTNPKHPYGPNTAAYSPFVTKINTANTGSASLVYSTYLAGTYDESGNGIAVDAAGNAYVTGWTWSSDFPTTAGAFQTTFSGQGDAFVTELNANGSALVYSTYLGGTKSYNDSGRGIAVDAAGNAYVAGITQAADFPTTAGAFQRTKGGLEDAFVTKLNLSGSALVYSTFLGGSGGDEALGLAVDAAGNAYVVGNTSSANFPTTPGALQRTIAGGGDAFVSEVNSSGSALVYSSYLGGSGNDYGEGIAVDAAGNAYVVGESTSLNFPTTPGAIQPTSRDGDDAFVAKIATAAAPYFAVNGFPSPSTAGVPGTFTITAKDASGATATNYTGTVHFSSGDAQAVLPADYTFTAADAGVHTFSATLKTAGNQSITATDVTTGDIAGTQAQITVKPAAASTFLVAGFPSPTTAGAAHSFTVTAQDAFGNTVTGYTGTVHFTSSDSRAVLPAKYAFRAADAGTHTFSATSKTAGTQAITATDTVTAGITGAEPRITVNPAAASKLVFLSSPASVKAGTAFSVTIEFLDAYGNVATGYTGTVHFTSSDGTAVLPANFTFTAADNGQHTFTDLELKKKGSAKITVTDTANSSLTASATVSVL